MASEEAASPKDMVSINISEDAPPTKQQTADADSPSTKVAVLRKISSRKKIALAVGRTLRRRKQDAKVLARDFTQLKSATEPLEQFYFLRNDAHPVHGLQNWSAEEWTHHLHQLPGMARDLAKALDEDGDGLTTETAFESLALRIKEHLGESLRMSQWHAVWSFQNAAINMRLPDGAMLHYMSPDILGNMLFDRDFPLGVEERILRARGKHAIAHSGLHQVAHASNSAVTLLVYLAMLAVLLTGVAFLVRTLSRADLFAIEATSQDPATVGRSAIDTRVKTRAQAASLIVSVSFSLCTNGLLDKIGLIDPSTSTVFVGITLGGTWGFVLDNLLGTDEGFREFLWDPFDGMRYAMGTLTTGRFGRFIVTLLFDMFITVILFKAGYTKLVAGFTVSGREWIANGFVSSIISVMTFAVYANLTRTQWAYPSGEEAVLNQWISGHVMTLATVIMNMVYLTCETRARIGEPGINDPNVKIFVTGACFFTIFVLSLYGQLDPSATDEDLAATSSVWSDLARSNLSLPLPTVCYTRARYLSGFAFFAAISAMCLAVVIFGTSAQSLTGLRVMFCSSSAEPASNHAHGHGDAAAAAAPEQSDAGGTATRNPSMASLSGGIGRSSISLNAEGKRRGGRNAAPVDSEGRSVPIKKDVSTSDRFKGKCVLFWIFMLLVACNVLVFSVVPFYSATREGYVRDTDLVRQACPTYYD